MMYLILVVAAITSQTVFAEVNYKHVQTPNGGAYGGTFNSNGVSGGFGGGYSSSGYGGGYGGSYGSGSGTNGGYGAAVGSRGSFSDSASGSIPGGFDSFVNPSEFERFLTGHFDNLQRNYASLYEQHMRSQQDLFNTIKNQFKYAGYGGSGGYGGGPTYSNGGGSNYASAGASYGPGGIHQTAQVYPENAKNPNVDVRFDVADPSGNSNFYGVASSSFSESSNINGKETSHKGAITTVNDNGKITTYKSGDQ